MKYLLILLTTLIFVSTAVAQVPNKSVGTRQLKNNAVKTKKINDGAVMEAKLANQAVTEVKIADEAVTGAKVATNGLDHTKISEVTNIPAISLTNGLTRTIYEEGAITLQAKCIINVGGFDRARILVFSDEDGTAFDGQTSNTNLTAASAENDRLLAEANTNVTTTPSIDQESDGMIMTPSGAVYAGLLVTGVNLFGQTGTCHFGGMVYRILADEE
jgi:hypothetical protein